MEIASRGPRLSFVPNSPRTKKGISKNRPNLEELEYITENDFLETDEIAMLYNEETGFIITPFYLSLENMMKTLKLRYYGTTKIDEYWSVDYFGDGQNLVKVLYKDQAFRYTFNQPHESNETIINYPTICIEPNVLIKSKEGSFKELDIRPIIENYNKNVFKRATEELLLFCKIHYNEPKIQSVV